MGELTELEKAQQELSIRLAALPGLRAVGIGAKEIAGTLTERAAIKVYVEYKRPLEDIPVEERIPATFLGFATDVVETGVISDVAGPSGADRPGDFDRGDDARHRPLTGGIQIVADDGPGIAGTLGCFVWEQADHNKVYALTCHHIAAPLGGKPAVGQPTAMGSWCDCCIGVFGRCAAGDIELVNRRDRDEALVRLNPGAQYMADIIGAGALGADIVVRGQHHLSDTEAWSGKYAVRKRGQRTRLTGGVVGSRVASTTVSNNILIINANPASSGGTSFFAFEGDSGSVVINDSDEVVGLVYARDDSGHGYALTIDNVLNRLAADLGGGVALQPATAANPGIVQTVPGVAMVAVPAEVTSALNSVSVVGIELKVPVGGWALPDAPSQPAVLAQIGRDLDESPSGRQLVQLWLDHHDELAALFHSNRRLASAWHRSGAAALFQLFTRMSADPSVRFPESVHGQPIGRCIEQVYQLFAQSATARLRRDLERARSLLPNLAGCTYGEIIDDLGAN
jgi:hypothetical protein